MLHWGTAIISSYNYPAYVHTCMCIVKTRTLYEELCSKVMHDSVFVFQMVQLEETSGSRETAYWSSHPGKGWYHLRRPLEVWSDLHLSKSAVPFQPMPQAWLPKGQCNGVVDSVHGRAEDTACPGQGSHWAAGIAGDFNLQLLSVERVRKKILYKLCVPRQSLCIPLMSNFVHVRTDLMMSYWHYRNYGAYQGMYYAHNYMCMHVVFQVMHGALLYVHAITDPFWVSTVSGTSICGMQ